MHRRGYTLLEVLLAIAIGFLIVTALYVAMDVQFRYAQSGRNAVAEGQLARGLLARIGADVRLSLASLPTRNLGTASSPTGQLGGEASAAGTAQGADPNSTSGQAEGTTATGTTGQFNYGILGDETQIQLYVSSMPKYARTDAEAQTGASDLGRITYWLEPGAGLARQEVRNISPGEESDASSVILASEVVDLRFRYYDPVTASWLTSWDGSTSGPPLAVEINLTLRPSPDGTMGRRPTEEYLSSYRLVVSIPTSNIPADESATTTPATASSR
jgi:prepilin-type N-terminal cleavage/methylation domain-containing protein